MRIAFEDGFFSELAEREAEARGVAGRLRALAAAREDDGLSHDEAVEDAAESLGIAADLDTAIGEALLPLAAHEVDKVLLLDAHAEMPTLRLDAPLARVWLPKGDLGASLELLQRLVQQQVADPDRTVVSLEIGLGGTGGCACGDPLPEDEAPGPLFERHRVRPRIAS